jgi:hypothetical protein
VALAFSYWYRESILSIVLHCFKLRYYQSNIRIEEIKLNIPVKWVAQLLDTE